MTQSNISTQFDSQFQEFSNRLAIAKLNHEKRFVF
jgi:hypothetical protein